MNGQQEAKAWALTLTFPELALRYWEIQAVPHDRRTERERAVVTRYFAEAGPPARHGKQQGRETWWR
jgi:hypothetical protein